MAGAGVEEVPTTLDFAGPLSGLPGVDATAYRRAWVKSDATAAADSDDATAAIWQIGGGRVVAANVELPPEVVALVADRLGGTSAGEFAVRWEDGEVLSVTVDAPAASRVELRRDGEVYPAKRAGAATWRAEVAGPRRPATATLFIDGQVADRRATAGRYAAEFERNWQRRRGDASPGSGRGAGRVARLAAAAGAGGFDAVGGAGVGGVYATAAAFALRR